MKDLVITYENKNDETITIKYGCIYDFTEDMESNKADVPMLDYKMLKLISGKIHCIISILKLLPTYISTVKIF